MTYVRAAADELAHWVWERRHDLDAECLDAAEAMDRAEEGLFLTGPDVTLTFENSKIEGLNG